MPTPPGALLPRYQIRYKPLEANGDPMPFAQLWFYVAGTSIPQPVYADADLTTPLSNPLLADANGEFPTWYGDRSTGYKERLLRADGSLVFGGDDILANPHLEPQDAIEPTAAPPVVVSIVRHDASPTNAASVSWTVTFSTPVTGVSSGAFSLDAAGLSGAAITGVTGAGTSYLVTASAGSGAGSLRLSLTTVTGILDADSQELAATFTGQAYVIDRIAPTCSSITRAGDVTTDTTTLGWLVTFSEPVTGVSLTAFALLPGGGVAGASLTSVTGSGTSYTVTANRGSGDGTLGLSVLNDGTINDLVGNGLAAAASGGVYTIATPPVTEDLPILGGILARTIGSLVGLATGRLDINGALAKTFGGATILADGQLDGGALAALSQTLASLSKVATGAVSVVGTLARSLGSLTGTAASQAQVSGQLSRTLRAATATATGDTGSLALASPLAANVHPRLLLNATETPVHAARASSGGEWNSEFQTFVTTVQAYWTVPVGDIAFYRLARLAMSAAYVYRLFPSLSGVAFGASSNTQAAWGAKGREWLLAYKAADPTLGQAEWPPARCAIYATDWLWPVLAPSDRSSLLTFFKQVDEDAWIAPYTNDTAALLGAAQANWANNQHQQAWSLKIMAGLVFAGAGLDDAWASYSYTAYTIVARRPGAGWITMETQRGGTDGSWSMGLIYGISYEQFPMIHCEAAWRTANGISRAAHYTAAEAGNVLGMPIYGGFHIRAWGPTNSLTPRGATTFGLKDFHTGWTGDFNQGDYSICAGFALVASELDGVSQNRADYARYIRTRFFEEANDPEVWILTRFLGPKGTEKTAAQAGVASQYAMAMGEWHINSGVHASLNDSQVALYGHRFSHDSGCSGHFSVDYMGPVIVTPGVGGHDRDASWAYGFVNMLGAPEEGRSTPESPIEGSIACEDMGFKRIYQNGSENLVAGALGDWNDLSLARFHAPVGSEKAASLFLDQRRNYNSDLINDNAITSQSVKWVDPTRQFIVINPATPGVDSLKVWILDRGAVKAHTPNFHRRLVYYLTGDPTIDGSASAGPSRGAAGTDGKTTYTGATLVSLAQTTNGMNNKLWLRVYSPTGYQIVKVNFRRGTSETTVEDAYGQLFEESSMGGDAVSARPYAGTHRVEFIPTVHNLSEVFLTGIEVTPAAGAESARAQLTTTGSFISERIGTDIVVVATATGASAGSVVLPDLTGTVRVIFADLPVSAARTFTKGASLGTVTRAADGDTDLSFTTSPEGTLELTVAVTAGGDSASRTLTFS